ncbi:MAG: glycoside hydrolase family 25 protein [Thermoanaerobaculia bacterium]
MTLRLALRSQFPGAAALVLLLPTIALAGPQPQSSVGIDVSHHSGAIDWDVVAGHEFRFVYLKATEGIDDADPMFEAFRGALDRIRVPRGAYHFFVSEDDPDEQARFFLAQAKIGPGELVPVVDVETIGHGTTGDLSRKLRRILERIEEEVGARPMIYTTARFWNAHFEPTFGSYPLWVAEYGVDEPELPAGWQEWTLWQYQGDAEIPGIEKGADRSRLRPGLELDSLLVPARRGGPAALPPDGTPQPPG